MQVKFCGITNIEDARNAIDLGIDYLGFIIDFPKSPRSLEINNFLKLAREIKDDYKDNVKIVAVTVDMEEEKLYKIVESKLVDVIQLHGNESFEYCEKFKDKIEIWKNISIRNYELEITNYKNVVDRLLMDATSIEEKIGGQYNKFDNFKEFKELKEKGYPLVLAGGLNPENIGDYLKKLNPDIVDVASGVESEPGKKDFEKMRLFMEVINNKR